MRILQSGNDRMYGSSGHDRMFANDGNDFMHGGPGNDLLVGGPDIDAVFGGGLDLIFPKSDFGGITTVLRHSGVGTGVHSMPTPF